MEYDRSFDIIKMIMYDARHRNFREFVMAKNKPFGDGHRIGAVRDRSQTQTPSGHYVKRDAETGRFMDVKTSDKTPFKGVRREKN
ncbi:hypothetical protein [Burkholderia orbicola]|nr:hypothetical protein [Burkholderia orbicola]MDN7534669.1 hypothetical protein [Burkholderia orbicola]